MNRLSMERQAQIISCLVEGNSIRSIERMTGTHRDTIMRLTLNVGEKCSRIMDEHMRNLDCQRIQVDEIWTYVQKKQRQVIPGFDDQSRVGDQWTFVALDPDTKLVPTYLIGKRTLESATAFAAKILDGSKKATKTQIKTLAASALADTKVSRTCKKKKK